MSKILRKKNTFVLGTQKHFWIDYYCLLPLSRYYDSKKRPPKTRKQRICCVVCLLSPFVVVIKKKQSFIIGVVVT